MLYAKYADGAYWFDLRDWDPADIVPGWYRDVVVVAEVDGKEYISGLVTLPPGIPLTVTINAPNLSAIDVGALAPPKSAVQKLAPGQFENITALLKASGFEAALKYEKAGENQLFADSVPWKDHLTDYHKIPGKDDKILPKNDKNLSWSGDDIDSYIPMELFVQPGNGETTGFIGMLGIYPPGSAVVLGAGITFDLNDGLTMPESVAEVMAEFDLNKVFTAKNIFNLFQLFGQLLDDGLISLSGGTLAINVPIVVVDGPAPENHPGLVRPIPGEPYGLIATMNVIVIYDGEEDGVVKDPIILARKQSRAGPGPGPASGNHGGGGCDAGLAVLGALALAAC
jgi:hypothetical protein